MLLEDQPKLALLIYIWFECRVILNYVYLITKRREEKEQNTKRWKGNFLLHGVSQKEPTRSRIWVTMSRFW
jgi:hypothetical protein